MKKQFDANANPATFGEQLLFYLMANPNQPVVIMRVGDVVYVEGAEHESTDGGAFDSGSLDLSDDTP